MCTKFDASLSDHELSVLLATRHHLYGDHALSAVALGLETLDCERSRLRHYIESLAQKDGMAHRIIAQFLLSELPERPRR